MTTQPGSQALALLEELRGRIGGDVRADRLSRALYATDASLYQIVPDGVVMPRSAGDVIATMKACARHRVPLTARGAGTGLAGGAVNRGIQLDCSRYFNRIIEIDPAGRTARVEPGVVLDELNAELQPHGLHFAPDVATSSRATLGGMIANNSCGTHSVRYGRTADHVLSLDLVLSDGSRCRWGSVAAPTGSDLSERCERALAEVAHAYADDIRSRYPKILRRNGGYALDRLRAEDGRVANPETILCGSEGTLAVVVEATLKLTPLPRHRGLVVAHFRDLLESLSATPVILAHEPAAVELIDRLVLEAAMRHPTMARRCGAVEGDPAALLLIELFDENAADLTRRLRAVADDLHHRRMGYARPILTEAKPQAEVWNIRSSGLGLLMSRPGDRQPYAFVEDTAVDPARLRDYIERFARILDEEQVEQAGYYAHASVGCLHVRPVLNLRDRGDVERMRRIADRVSSLALAFGGTMTGEHGDGIVRSCWLEKMYGPRIIEAFGRIKSVFDPNGLMNPGKIVAPMPMTEHLRYDSLPEPSAEPSGPGTRLDFSEHGGMLGLANMCSGVGQCRQRLVGTMCPSYMATGDEQHTTRGRANALRMALSGERLLEGLSDPAIEEVLDLCLGCKACKTECPTGVDMARLKAEWLSQRQALEGVPLRSRFIAAAPDLARLGSLLPGVANAVLQSGWARAIAERAFGIDRRVPPPRLARETFRHWFERRRRDGEPSDPKGKTPVVYFVDTWTDCFTPQVGVATIEVLEALGYRVIVPPTVCCGRPAISKGLLDEATRLLEENVRVLTEQTDAGTAIIGTEPSCLLTLVDELPQLVRTRAARQVAARATTIESFIAEALRERRDRIRFKAGGPPVLYHGHCHQKALVGTAEAMRVLDAATGGRADEINSGCCGMAGAFGHEIEHYDVARAIGEQRLFPAIRGRGDAEIVVSGFSCRHQVTHHTAACPRHVIEVFAERMDRRGACGSG
ncbi:MAG: FAD-binding and (Fe-S)-binding domain-containing protein [Phycisphaerae bacterium]